MSDDARLESIESKLAFQEDAVQRLNEALVAQQTRIDRIEAIVKTLAEQIRGQQEAAAATPEPPPPHY